eukprot:1473687-Pyramimonas_sp.AAC.1
MSQTRPEVGAPRLVAEEIVAIEDCEAEITCWGALPSRCQVIDVAPGVNAAQRGARPADRSNMVRPCLAPSDIRHLRMR